MVRCRETIANDDSKSANSRSSQVLSAVSVSHGAVAKCASVSGLVWFQNIKMPIVGCARRYVVIDSDVVLITARVNT